MPAGPCGGPLLHHPARRLYGPGLLAITIHLHQGTSRHGWSLWWFEAACYHNKTMPCILHAVPSLTYCTYDSLYEEHAHCAYLACHADA